MVKVSAKSLQSPQLFSSETEITRVDYALGKLVVHVRGMANEPGLTVEFVDVRGFRMLDERDISNFWPTCSTPEGWLFEIFSGGWRAQEDETTGGLFSAWNFPAREFLVTGIEDCLSVLCLETPIVKPDLL